jgi:hypothetical protein
VPGAQRLRIIVLGYLVRGPLGGLAWHYLQYVMGLRALGHDVFYVEDSADHLDCLDPRTFTSTRDPAYGLSYLSDAFRQLDIDAAWAYHDAATQVWHGPAAGRINELARTADVVLNISAVNPIAAFADVPVRVMIDTDPAFTQVHHLGDSSRLAFARQHTTFFTYGENIPAGRSQVPSDGLPWKPTRQPIVLDAWPVTPGPAHGAFSTVMLWNSYAAMTHDGRRYGMKSDSFAAFESLPARSGERFEIVSDTRGTPARLGALGWAPRDPSTAAGSPHDFQEYLRLSRAEFSVAKEGYVSSRSGWFSERSACYLASGRPVIVQDTGFSSWLPSGTGVLPFTTLEEAADAVDRVSRDYGAHCRAARTIAEAHFDARTVLSDLLDRAAATRDSLTA